MRSVGDSDCLWNSSSVGIAGSYWNDCFWWAFSFWEDLLESLTPDDFVGEDVESTAILFKYCN